MGIERVELDEVSSRENGFFCLNRHVADRKSVV